MHLGAIPAPGLASDVATFHNNMLATFNVFQAARRLGITRIVYASSETVLGLPFDVPPPYIPVDEEYAARPESTYSLVKHLEEQMAIELVRWHPELSITALRFSNVMDPADYAAFPSFDADATLRKWNLWGYIDGRDGAQAVSLALTTAGPGFERFIIAAADTVMSRPNAELVAEVFPGVEVRGDLGDQRHDALDREGPPPARLRAAPLMARRGDGCRGIRSPELTAQQPGRPDDERPRSRSCGGVLRAVT